MYGRSFIVRIPLSNRSRAGLDSPQTMRCPRIVTPHVSSSIQSLCYRLPSTNPDDQYLIRCNELEILSAQLLLAARVSPLAAAVAVAPHAGLTPIRTLLTAHCSPTPQISSLKDPKMWLVKKALNRGDNFDLTANLRDAGVPFSPLDDACKSCEAPCDVADLGTYPSLFIDHMSNLLGRVKPFGRQVRSMLLRWGWSGPDGSR